MISWDSFNYAMENTRVIMPPQRRLETFGTTVLNYHLITEDMDKVNLSHVREGRIEAGKPQIVSPATFSKLLLDGFGEKAEQFAELLNRHSEHFAVLKYGFNIRKAEATAYELHEPFEAVLEKVQTHVKGKNDPLAVVISGIDDAWEVCLLKFMFDMIAASGAGNIDDLRNRGML